MRQTGIKHQIKCKRFCRKGSMLNYYILLAPFPQKYTYFEGCCNHIEHFTNRGFKNMVYISLWWHVILLCIERTTVSALFIWCRCKQPQIEADSPCLNPVASFTFQIKCNAVQSQNKKTCCSHNTLWLHCDINVTQSCVLMLHNFTKRDLRTGLEICISTV